MTRSGRIKTAVASAVLLAAVSLGLWAKFKSEPDCLDTKGKPAVCTEKIKKVMLNLDGCCVGCYDDPYRFDVSFDNEVAVCHYQSVIVTLRNNNSFHGVRIILTTLDNTSNNEPDTKLGFADGQIYGVRYLFSSPIPYNHNP